MATRLVGTVISLVVLLLRIESNCHAQDSKHDEMELQVGHQKVITCAEFSPEGNYLATGSVDGSVIVWDAQMGRRLRSFRADSKVVTGVAFSPSGKELAVCGRNEITFWELATGKWIKSFQPKHVQGRMTYSPDGKHLLIEVPRLGHFGIAQAIIFEIGSGRFRTLSHGVPGSDSRNDIAARYSPDGKFILTGSDDKLAIVWSASEQKKIRTFEGHKDRITAVGYASEGKRIATGSADKSIIVWDAETGRKLSTLTGKAPVIALTLGADANTLAASYDDGTILLWDIAKQAAIRE